MIAALILNPAHFRWLDRLPAPRMPRIRKRGVHHRMAGVRFDLFTATVPVKQTPDRPPWDRVTAAQPVLNDDAETLRLGGWGEVSQREAAEAEQMAEQMAEAYLP